MFAGGGRHVLERKKRRWKDVCKKYVLSGEEGGVMNLYQQYMYSYPHKTAYRSLEGVFLKDYVPYLWDQENSLYMHIPFCESKCGYCNLFSVVGQEEKVIDRYLDAMVRQTEQWGTLLAGDRAGENVRFSELVLGGGTPLYLTITQLQRVFNLAKEMGFSGKSIVVETSPRQTTVEKLQFLKEQGVTRLSMGVQSMQQKELDTLHRKHSVEEVERAMEQIKKVGFPCVNLDVIYGIPGQTMESLKDTLDRVLSYEVEELFLYPLYIKKDTWLYQEGKMQNEQIEQFYRFAREYLQRHGYTPRSMRRFTRKATEGKAKSCGYENTLSIGCGGRSYLGPLHFCTPYQVRQQECRMQLETYMETEDFSKITHGYLLTKEEEKRRFAIKNLLFYYGIDREEYKSLFDSELLVDFPMIEGWIEQGYVTTEGKRIFLTEEGMVRSDSLGPMFISEKVRQRMEEFWTKRA